MNWQSWSDFWSMGGYGVYVWGSYGATLVLILVEVLLLRGRNRAALDNARRFSTEHGTR